MYDILTLQLPEPEEEQAAGSLDDVRDMCASQKSPGPDVEELLDILDDPHIRVRLELIDWFTYISVIEILVGIIVPHFTQLFIF